MTNMITVNIPVTLDAEELWSETFGSGWEYAEFQISVDFKNDASWETPGNAGIAIVKIHDGETWQKAEVTPQTLADAFAKLSAIGYHHCGAPLALGDFDACASADMLQMAVFSELVYA